MATWASPTQMAPHAVLTQPFLRPATPQAQAVANLVTAYPSVRLLTYEAGPSIVEARTLSSGYYTAGLAAKFIAVNRHPRFEGVFSMWVVMAVCERFRCTAAVHTVAAQPPALHGLHASMIRKGAHSHGTSSSCLDALHVPAGT